MISSLVLLPQFEKKGIVARLDPRTKMFCSLCVLGMITRFSDLKFLLIITIGVIGAGCLIGAGPPLARAKWFVLVVIAFSTVTWAVQIGGAMLPHFGFRLIPKEAWMFSAAMGLRFGSLLLSGLLFLSITTATDLQDALTSLRFPHAMVFTFSLSLRLLPAYVDTAVGILESQRARGLDLRMGSLRTRARNCLSLAVPLFMHAVRQTHLLAIGLESRAFSPVEARSCYRTLRLRLADYLVIVLFFVAALGVCWATSRVFGVVSSPSL